MIENWRPVVGFEEFYEVSDQGRVRSITRLVKASRGGFRTHAGKILKPHSHVAGYPMAALSVNGVITHRTVHSLVAEAFIGPRPPGQQVRHKSTDKSDSSLENIEYGTVKENMKDKMRDGTQPQGEGVYCAKLKEADVIEIRNRRAAGELLKDIAENFGLTEVYVWQITTGKKWKSAPGPITAKKQYLKMRGGK